MEDELEVAEEGVMDIDVDLCGPGGLPATGGGVEGERNELGRGGGPPEGAVLR